MPRRAKTPVTMLPLLMTLMLSRHGSCSIYGSSSSGKSSVYGSSSKVGLPSKHVAMESDLEVTFNLPRANAFTFNAMIHIEYLPGDASLPSSASTTKPVRLASLPVPLGLRSGAVVFSCSTVRRAGPHRAYLTVNGDRAADSEILHVEWPPVLISVPRRLRIHASDVSVSVSFTRSLCATFTNSKTSKKKKKSKDFTATLELIECSKSIIDPDSQDCQAPNPPNSRIWYSKPITDLYRRASFSATLDCSVWGQSGTFRVYLRANLTHSGVVARSEAVRVETNPEYAISSPEAQFVLPCVGRDNVRALEVGRPKCSGVQDRIRVYGQGYHVAGEGNLIPSQWDYLGEERISSQDSSSSSSNNNNIVNIPCRMFGGGDRYWRYCFHYVSISKVGTTDTFTKLCLPAKDEASSSIAVATWTSWNSWSSCSHTCGRSGLQTRYRICHLPTDKNRRILCEGHRVEQRPCTLLEACHGEEEDSIPPFGTSGNDKTQVSRFGSIWRPLFVGSTISPCACGCIYIVGRSRRVKLTSARDCHVGIGNEAVTWRVKASMENQTLSVRVKLVQVSCLEGVLSIRDLKTDSKSMDSSVSATMVRRVDFFDSKGPFSFNTSGSVASFELRSSEVNNGMVIQSNRSCRINLELEVVAVDAQSPASPASNILHSISTFFRSVLLDRLSLLLLLAASILLVVLLCCCFLVCQFEYRRKRYVAWKSQPSSGYSSPDDEGEDGHKRTLTRQATDAETGHSSVEELVPLMSSARPDLLPDERRFAGRSDFQLQQMKKRQRREARRKMRMTLTNLLREEELHKLIKEKEGERLSLPASPFLTRRLNNNDKKNKSKNSKPVTAEQVKRALAEKSRRYRMGNFKPLGGRPGPPPQSPTDFIVRAKRTKSLTDLSTFLQGRLDSGNNSRSVKRQRSRRKQQYNSRTLPNKNHNKTSRQARPVSSSSFHRKLQTYSREAAGSRLSNATAASSQLSVDSCELELDLYDYNLDNVAANSMFAAQLPLNQWSFDDDDLNTPIAEEFQLRDLFPNSNNNNNLEEDEVTLREHPIGMTNSRTSDLTASVTSAELSNDVYGGKMTFSSFKPPPPPPTAKNSTTTAGVSANNRPNILSLTHIDGDDISFADNNSSDNDDTAAFMPPKTTTQGYRQQYTKC